MNMLLTYTNTYATFVMYNLIVLGGKKKKENLITVSENDI